jgi:hypothetical protein
MVSTLARRHFHVTVDDGDLAGGVVIEARACDAVLRRARHDDGRLRDDALDLGPVAGHGAGILVVATSVFDLQFGGFERRAGLLRLDVAGEDRGLAGVVDVEAVRGDVDRTFAAAEQRCCRRLRGRRVARGRTFILRRYEMRLHVVDEGDLAALVQQPHLVGANGARWHVDEDGLLGEDHVVVGEDGGARQLRLHAAFGDDIDAAGELQLVRFGVELAVRCGELRLRFLGIGHVAGDVVEAHELGVDEILYGGLRPDDVLPPVLVEPLVARVIHRQVVGDDARHLELRQRRDPAGGVEDHQEVDDDDAGAGGG